GKKVVIFGLPGAYTGVCSQQHVPSYKNNIEKFKAKGIDSIICVAVNDPYTLNGWAEKLQAKEVVSCLTSPCIFPFQWLDETSFRWSAYVVDGKVQAFNVEKKPSDFQVSEAEVILGQI
ncbi:hypothetical protein HPP92_027866, partial [Vanilla planifolia]